MESGVLDKTDMQKIQGGRPGQVWEMQSQFYIMLIIKHSVKYGRTQRVLGARSFASDIEGGERLICLW